MVGESFLEGPTVCLIHKPCATIFLLSPGSSVVATPQPEGPTPGWAPGASAAPQAETFWDGTLPSLRAQSLRRGGSSPFPPGARIRVLPPHGDKQSQANQRKWNLCTEPPELAPFAGTVWKLAQNKAISQKAIRDASSLPVCSWRLKLWGRGGSHTNSSLGWALVDWEAAL